MKALNQLLVALNGRQDVLFTLFFVMVATMLVIPLPTFLIDILIVVNLSVSIIVLIAALYLKSVLDLSTFPALILVTTLFRLALTVSTTRLILAQADGGKVIAGFGQFVVGSNVVVGLVIFFIVAFVQFLVVTKGAERIAEVSARFTLDALPGKQMAIDADLRSGDIDKEEARTRRFVLTQESQFFGAMDGAMRFVKGDAIAALVVVFVNLFGGLIIGMAQKGMRAAEAIHVYSTLSIGDGLVAQIPSMFIAISAGIVVTRVATDKSSNLGRDIGMQLTAEPRALLVAGGIVALFSAVPGFPTVTFLIIAAALGGTGLYLARGRDAATRADADAVTEAEQTAARASSDAREKLPPSKPGEVFTLLAAPELIARLEAGGIAKRYAQAHAELARQLGFNLPNPGFTQDERMRGLQFLIEGVPAGSLPEADSQDAEKVIAFATRRMRQEAARAFDLDAAAAWLGEQRKIHPKLVADVEQAASTLLVVDFCRELLEDDLPLTQSRPILETILRAQRYSNKVNDMVDAARMLMKRSITQRHMDADGTVNLIICSPDAENVLRRAAEQNAGMRAAPALGEEVRRILDQIRQQEIASTRDQRPVVVAVPGDMRRSVKTLLGIQASQLPVVAFSELEQGSKLRTVLVLTSQYQAGAPAQRAPTQGQQPTRGLGLPN